MRRCVSHSAHKANPGNPHPKRHHDSWEKEERSDANRTDSRVGANAQKDANARKEAKPHRVLLNRILRGQSDRSREQNLPVSDTHGTRVCAEHGHRGKSREQSLPGSDTRAPTGCAEIRTRAGMVNMRSNPKGSGNSHRIATESVTKQKVRGHVLDGGDTQFPAATAHYRQSFSLGPDRAMPATAKMFLQAVSLWEYRNAHNTGESLLTVIQRRVALLL